jgi:hypothetical protein
MKEKRTFGTIVFVFATLLFGITSNIHGNQLQTAMAIPSPSSESHKIDPVSVTAADNLKAAFRDLWVDHIIYTRNFIISYLAGLPDTNIVSARLLKNQEDIGNAIKPFYGQAAGIKLTDLLKGHIVGAVDLLKAAKNSNTTGTATAEKKWYENADQIAAFLAGANPSWSKQDLMTMLHNHLALTKSEAVARLTGNYQNDIASFDKIHGQAMMMSDALVNGIIKQFPDKFSTIASSGPFSSNSTHNTNTKT